MFVSVTRKITVFRRMNNSIYLSTTILGLILIFSLIAGGYLPSAKAIQPTGDGVAVYGGTGDDVGYCVIQTSDGGYVITGTTNSFGAGYNDVYLMKTDSAGVLLWNNTYGGTFEDDGYSVIQTSDGGYAIAGTTGSSGNYDVYLIKTDSVGQLLWSKSYGGASGDIGYSLVQTSDGGYAIAGTTYSFGAGGSDIYLVKTDSAGVELWSYAYGGANDDSGSSLIQTSDGGYAIAGTTNSAGAGGKDFNLLKTDSTGHKLWMSAYGAAGDEVGSSVIQTSDGGYAIAGTATNGSNTADTHITIVKADSTDNMLWATGYGTGGDVGSSMVQTSDGGFAIAGSTIPSMTNSLTTGGKILWLVKMDSTGNEVWNRGSGGVTGESVGNSVVKTSDGGYAVAGYTTSFGAGDRDVYLVKINSDGNIDQSFNPSPSTEPTAKVPEFPAQFIGITLIVVMIAILSVVILAKKKIKN